MIDRGADFEVLVVGSDFRDGMGFPCWGQTHSLLTPMERARIYCYGFVAAVKRDVPSTEELVNALVGSLMYAAGVKPGASTFIDEVTITYGYGKLSEIGDWEFPLYGVPGDRTH